MSTFRVVHDRSILTELALERLLVWLDDGVESHGERYLEIRRRLVAYFDRRSRAAAEDLADETLNRIARTLEQDGAIATTPPARYCYVVARFVLLEDFRRERMDAALEERRRRVGDDRARGRGLVAIDRSSEVRDQRLDCLDRCLEELPAVQRELIVEYYRESGRAKIDRRRALADRLGITMNALGIRACRIRDALMGCVEACRRGR